MGEKAQAGTLYGKDDEQVRPVKDQGTVRRSRKSTLQTAYARRTPKPGDEGKSNILSIIVPAAGTIVVALIGTLFTYRYNATQAQNARVELVSKLLPDLLSENAAKQRASLITIASVGDEELALRLSSILDTDSSRRVLGDLLIEGIRTADDRLVNLVARTGIAGRYSPNMPVDSLGRNPYQLAALFNNIAAIDILGRYQASPDFVQQTAAGYSVPSAMERAAQYGNLAIFRSLMRAGSKLGASYPVLTAAATAGHISILDEAMKIEGSLDLLNTVYLARPTPLTAAAAARNAEGVEWLLKAGAKPNTIDGNGNIALVSVFVDYFIPPNNSAVTRIVALLLKHGARPRVVVEGKPDLSAVHGAIQTHQNDALEILLKENADPNAQAGRSETPLALAAHFDDAAAAEILLKYKADPNYLDGEPIRSAVFFKAPDILRMLLQHGGKVNINGQSLMTIAADRVAYSGPTRDARFEQEEEANRLKCIDLLIAAGEKLDQTNVFGVTALYQAIYNNDQPVINRLLEVGASPDAGSEFQGTPIYHAATHDDVDYSSASWFAQHAKLSYSILQRKGRSTQSTILRFRSSSKASTPN